MIMSKTRKNSIGIKSYYINENTCKEYQNLASEVLISLYYLESLIIERAKNE